MNSELALCCNVGMWLLIYTHYPQESGLMESCSSIQTYLAFFVKICRDSLGCKHSLWSSLSPIFPLKDQGSIIENKIAAKLQE